MRAPVQRPGGIPDSGIGGWLREPLGDTERMVDTLLERRERWGLTYLTCFEEDLDLFAPVVARLVGR